MLKMAVLKMLKKTKQSKSKNKNKTNKQCIAIILYKWKLSLFGRDGIKQAKALFSLWSLKQNKFQKYKKKLKEMLLESSFVME